MKNTLLRDRSEMLRKARNFFAQRNVLEVDCPALSLSAPVDLHIEVMSVLLDGQLGYLHTSAEYGMKRLLSEGIGDIYQISHVFRRGEIGPLHNPEFTMAEWYRCGFTFEQMIEETLDFIRLFLGNLPSEHITYADAFQKYLHIDYTQQTPQDLLALCQSHGITLSDDAQHWNKDTLLQLLVSIAIEPHLGKDHLLVLTHYPASQAALAKTEHLPHGAEIAYRFEIYYRGMELANGYHELTDPIEQKQRFTKTNAARAHAGKEPLKVDEKFLQALDKGLPDCCGVAVGFDRLMVLKHNQSSLENILPFSWQEV
jgi:elongation factor P--(R)-beta-lysine ligase